VTGYTSLQEPTSVQRHDKGLNDDAVNAWLAALVRAKDREAGAWKLNMTLPWFSSLSVSPRDVSPPFSK